MGDWADAAEDLAEAYDVAYDVGCERCGREFEFPTEGGQPDHGEFEGEPVCPDCYLESIEGVI
ncbi:hypothetical protein LCGC14_0955400 [marine sediment metagenome]|uniref:Uncharacterized protein n=1 Tax=marine sediment metagenome TaxID=412755 RepID=A0A0F9P280_9ZZZZ